MTVDYDFEKLEQALIRVGRELAYPPTPRLAVSVRQALPQEPARGWSGWPRWNLQPRAVMTVAIAIVVAVMLLLAFPETRNAIAQLLGLRSVIIIPVTPTPTLTSTPTLGPKETPRPSPSPTPTAIPRAQCCQTTLDDARARAKFKLLLPPSQPPSRVYVQELFNDGQQIILVYGNPNAPTFTLYQATNWLYGKFVQVGKEVSPGTVIEETKVKDQRALWLSGAPHLLVYLDARGQPVPESERTVNVNTLAWESTGEGITYRLETPLSKADAVRFAELLQ